MTENRCGHGNRVINEEWCDKCYKNNIYRRYCNAVNREIDDKEKDSPEAPH